MLLIMLLTQMTIGRVYFTVQAINEIIYWIAGGLIGVTIHEGIRYYFYSE